MFVTILLYQMQFLKNSCTFGRNSQFVEDAQCVVRSAKTASSEKKKGVAQGRQPHHQLDITGVVSDRRRRAGHRRGRRANRRV